MISYDVAVVCSMVLLRDEDYLLLVAVDGGIIAIGVAATAVAADQKQFFFFSFSTVM